MLPKKNLLPIFPSRIFWIQYEARLCLNPERLTILLPSPQLDSLKWKWPRSFPPQIAAPSDDFFHRASRGAGHLSSANPIHSYTTKDQAGLYRNHSWQKYRKKIALNNIKSLCPDVLISQNWRGVRRCKGRDKLRRKRSTGPFIKRTGAGDSQEGEYIWLAESSVRCNLEKLFRSLRHGYTRATVNITKLYASM